MGALMKYMAQIDYEPTTFIGAAYADFSSTVIPAGAEHVKGALSYQWFKDPQNPEVESDPGVEQFKADMTEYAPDGDASSTFTYTGYGVAAAIVSALRESDDVSSDSFLEAWDAVSDVENPLLIKGAALTAEADGRLVHQYQLNEFDGTSWVPQGELVNVVDEGIAK
jgi:branched-chain amino acid transport system substrate-binding protein